MTDSKRFETAASIACPDSKGFFSQYLDEVYRYWASFNQSKIPISTTRPGWQEHAIGMLSHIDRFIMENESIPRLQRIGYISLSILMDDIKYAIFVDRRCGLIQLKRGQRDKSLCLDLYLAAQGPVANRIRTKRQLSKRLEMCRKWRSFSISCPLLAMTYGDKAERIVWVISTSGTEKCWQNTAPAAMRLARLCKN